MTKISEATVVDIQAGDLIPIYRPGQESTDKFAIESTDEEWTAWTPTMATNEHSGGLTSVGYYNKIGRQVTVSIFIQGNSGTVQTFTILNLPFASARTFRQIAWISNNSVSAAGRFEVLAASPNTVVLYPSFTAAANTWATTGTKNLFITLTYESTT